MQFLDRPKKAGDPDGGVAEPAEKPAGRRSALTAARPAETHLDLAATPSWVAASEAGSGPPHSNRTSDRRLSVAGEVVETSWVDPRRYAPYTATDRDITEQLCGWPASRSVSIASTDRRVSSPAGRHTEEFLEVVKAGLEDPLNGIGRVVRARPLRLETAFPLDHCFVALLPDPDGGVVVGHR